MHRLRNYYRGNGVLENKLLLIVCFENHGVFIKALDPAGQFDATHQVDGEKGFVLSGVVEERFLNILRRLFHL